MKKLILLVLFINFQSFADLLELNSGVTTQLNSVSNGLFTINTFSIWACGNNGTIIKDFSYNFNNWLPMRNLTGNGVPTNVNLTNICAVVVLPPKSGHKVKPIC